MSNTVRTLKEAVQSRKDCCLNFRLNCNSSVCEKVIVTSLLKVKDDVLKGARKTQLLDQPEGALKDSLKRFSRAAV